MTQWILSISVNQIWFRNVFYSSSPLPVVPASDDVLVGDIVGRLNTGKNDSTRVLKIVVNEVGYSLNSYRERLPRYSASSTLTATD